MELPTTSRWREAASLDVEYTRTHRDMKQEAEEKKKQWAPRLSEYNLEAMLLLNISNLLGTMASGRRITSFQQLRPPITAFEVIEQNEEFITMVDLINHLTPGKLKREE